MTQPAVSIQLKNFQDQFDIPLTEIIGRKLYVTDFGKEIYTMAERVIRGMYAVNYKMMSCKGFMTGRLIISVVSIGKYVMPYFLADFSKKNPGVDLVMGVANKARVIKSLQNNEIDFALVSVLPNNINVNKEILLINQLHLVGNHEQKNKGVEIGEDELKEMSLIFREEGFGVCQTMEEYFRKHKFYIRKKMEMTSNEALKQGVIEGLRNSIMPLIGICDELLNGELKIIPAVGFPIKSHWYLIWLKNEKMNQWRKPT